MNVTREIDNFFPGMFDYLNVRVYDDEKTDLLKHWDNTFKYINKARNEGSKVLVHCKMGISRSASVVIAYAMKAFNWNFDRALKHVKTKRSCIKPNTNFLNQLETYQGILDAMKNKEKLQRSKSETNLKSPKSTSKAESKVDPTPFVLALTGSYRGRPRSWSPDTRVASELLPPPPPTSVSLENLAFETRHMLMPCANGSYSVSPNQIMRLKEEGAPSVKHIVNEIENAASGDRKEVGKRSQRLNFSNQNEPQSNKPLDVMAGSVMQVTDVPNKPPQPSPSKNFSHKLLASNSEVEKIHTWDPGEASWSRADENRTISNSDNIVKSDSGIIDIKTNKVTTSDIIGNIVERSNLECDDRRTVDDDAPPPSRQSSWSSFDSAVVLDLSRHSSWGSYDTRTARPQLPMPRDEPGKRNKDRSDERNVKKDEADRSTEPGSAPPKPSSDLGIITEHTETRTGLRRADNERKFNETCAILTELADAAARMERARDRGASTWSGRMSASAPADTWLRGAAGLRMRRATCASHGDLPRAAPAPASGLVSNLKKEFEARAETDAPRHAEARGRSATVEGRDRPPASPPSGEDLSVKVLVDRYDRPSRSRCESSCEARRSRARPEATAKKSRPAAPTVMSLAPLDYGDLVVSTVMSKAQTKKQLQHGKTHPLTRLNLNRSNNRCSNPVYNTM